MIAINAAVNAAACEMDAEKRPARPRGIPLAFRFAYQVESFTGHAITTSTAGQRPARTMQLGRCDANCRHAGGEPLAAEHETAQQVFAGRVVRDGQGDFHHGSLPSRG